MEKNMIVINLSDDERERIEHELIIEGHDEPITKDSIASFIHDLIANSL